MSHGLLPEKQHAWKSIEEESGRNAQIPKFLLMLQAEGIEKHCFQVHFVDTSKNFQALFKIFSAIIIVILSKES